MAVKMHRAKDKTDVLVEDWQVEEWKGYGFAVVPESKPAKADKPPKGEKGDKAADAEG